MAKGDKKVEFIKDFGTLKKGAKVTLSRDLANMVIGKKVAKLDEGKAVGRRKTKAKAKKVLKSLKSALIYLSELKPY